MSIPQRPSAAPTGSEALNTIYSNKSINRDSYLLQQIIAGNIPDLLRSFVPITISEKGNTLIYKVMPDYLAVGDNSDYIRVPLSGPESQKIADAFDCILPTPKMSDQIWKAATAKLAPQALSGSNSTIKGKTYTAKEMTGGKMSDTDTFEYHNQLIQNQLQQSGHKPGDLVAGNKKDVVISNDLISGRLAIHGLHDQNGKAIQQGGLSRHDENYKDYSSGTRLVSKEATLNGKNVNIKDVLKDPQYAYLINDGVLNVQSYNYDTKQKQDQMIAKKDDALDLMQKINDYVNKIKV